MVNGNRVNEQIINELIKMRQQVGNLEKLVAGLEPDERAVGNDDAVASFNRHRAVYQAFSPGIKLATGNYIENDSLIYHAERVEHLTTPPSDLTRRERQILNCMAQGYLNKQIAHVLGVCENTIKNHVTSIFRKLGVQSRTQAVVAALRFELLSLKG